jgi:hypothetical protein
LNRPALSRHPFCREKLWPFAGMWTGSLGLTPSNSPRCKENHQ